MENHLEPEEVIHIVSILTPQDKAFLVGGQALNFWVARYLSRIPILADQDPFTSKDIDYVGEYVVAEKLAEALGGTVERPSPGDMTPNSAVVLAQLKGKSVKIDFLHSVLGLLSSDLSKETAIFQIPFLVEGREERYFEISIMHPTACLKSRFANVLNPALARRDPVAIRQLGVSPLVLREYILEALQENQHREASSCLQIIFEYMRSDPIGRIAHKTTDIDLLDILQYFQLHPLVDTRYKTHSLPSMINEINKRRIAMNKVVVEQRVFAKLASILDECTT